MKAFSFERESRQASGPSVNFKERLHALTVRLSMQLAKRRGGLMKKRFTKEQSIGQAFCVRNVIFYTTKQAALGLYKNYVMNENLKEVVEDTILNLV